MTVPGVRPTDVPTVPDAILARADFQEEGEKIAAEAARSALLVEAELEPPILASYRAQLGVAARVAGDRAVGVLDASSGRFFAPVELARLVATEAPPRTRDLVLIHSIGPEGAGARLWLHTHGLARAGVPELEALRVRAGDRGQAVELLEGLAALLVSRDVAPRGVVALGDGLDIALLELDDALARLPDGTVGGEGSRDEEHQGPRVVVAPPGAHRDGSLLEIDALCDRVREVKVLFTSREETERQARLARERLVYFRRLFDRRPAGSVFLVKLAYATASGSREHLWFRVVAIESSRVEAVLENEPRDVPSLEKGARGWHSLDRLSDWVVIGPEGRIDPDRIDVVRG